MKRLIFNILLTFFVLPNLNAQDTLKTFLRGLEDAKTDSDKLFFYYNISKHCSNPDSVLYFAGKTIELAQRLGDSTTWCDAYGFLAWAYYNKTDIKKSLEYTSKQYEFAKQLKNKPLEGKALFNLAVAYYNANETSKSIELYRSALKLYTEIGDSVRIADIYRQIGNNSENLQLHDLAYQYISQAMDIDKKISNNENNLSIDYGIFADLIITGVEEKQDTFKLADLKVAKRYTDSSMAMLQNENDLYIISTVSVQAYYNYVKIFLIYAENGLGNVYVDSAAYYNQKFRALCDEYCHKKSLTESVLFDIQILLARKEYDKAVTSVEWAKLTTDDSMWLRTVARIYELSAKVYAAKGDYKQAYLDHQKYVENLTKFRNETNMLQAAEFRANVKTDEIVESIKLQNEKEIAVQEGKLHSQKLYIQLGLCLLAVLIILITMIFISWKHKRKSLKLLNEQNQKLSQQQNEIMAQQTVISEQKSAVEKANVEIYQSISYAKHIQQATLPTEEFVKSIFPDSFIYYLPKDIVSGDWYYAARNSGYDIFVLADCTGHGVPGGFLSMLGISAIKELLKNPEIDIEPGIILDMMRGYIKSTLANDIFMTNNNDHREESFSTADGMDMSICAINKDDYKLKFAGAYQSLYIVRDGEVIRLKGDRMPVGRHIQERPNFTTKYFDIKHGDMIYMQSDGIESQIGFTGTKFMTKRLKEFFVNNYKLPCDEQRAKIAQIMEEWLFGATQVDDLSLVGIRID
ncbi:MAG: SpoIIE family protein phosphatase [Bacteroidales bacterium]|nr:SpoIIE family protein phosphatase [Bacteroidales bacterium]